MEIDGSKAGTSFTINLKPAVISFPNNITATYKVGTSTYHPENGVFIMFPGTYDFKLVFNGNTIDTEIEIKDTDCQVLKGVNVIFVKDHNGDGLNGATLSYRPKSGPGGGGSYISIPGATTGDNGQGYFVHVYDDNRPYFSYRARYNETNSTSVEKDVRIDNYFEFQTNQLTVRVEDCDTGDPVSGVKLGWLPVSGGSSKPWISAANNTTDVTGEISAEIFPGTYSFSTDFNGGTAWQNNVVINENDSEQELIFTKIHFNIDWAHDVYYRRTTSSGTWFAFDKVNGIDFINDTELSLRLMNPCDPSGEKLLNIVVVRDGTNCNIVYSPDDEDPELVSVLPAPGNITLNSGVDFVWTVTAKDDNLVSLDVDQNVNASLPGFTVYANVTDPWGGQTAVESLATSLGINLSYAANGNEGTWTFTVASGSNAWNAFVANGGGSIYIALKDCNNNTWGDVQNPTNGNTFEYHIEQVWNGTIDTDWDKGGNWNTGVIPASGSIVKFATSPTNDLHVKEGATKIVSTLTNNSSKNLIIEADASLTVTDKVIIADDTNPNKIRIKAAANTPNGTFIVNPSTQTNDVYATVELYAKGYKESTPLTWTDDIAGSPTENQTFSTSYHWQYFGVPVESVKANPVFYGAAIRKYFETKNGTTYYQKWENIYNDDYLQAFEGYEITQDAATIYEIPGKLNFSDQTLTMTRQAPLVSGTNIPYGLGQNIFGNSYTAAINVNDIEFPAEAEKTVYLYNTGSLAYWANNGGTNDGTQVAGQYTAIPQEAATVIYDGQIPSMNGFLVMFDETNTVVGDAKPLSLKYNSVMANSKPQTAPEAPLSYLKVELTSKSTIDNLWLISQEGTTSGFDNGWDGRKYFGTPTAFIFTQSAKDLMQIDTDNTINGKRISFYANDDTDYTLTIDKQDLDMYQDLYLLDLKLRKVIALDEATTTYQFTAHNKGVVERRFLIANNADLAWGLDGINLLDAIYLSTGELMVNNYTGKNANIKIFDSSGRSMREIKSQQSVSETYQLNLPRGMYIANIEAGQEKAIVKLIVQ